jgi:hypothetical protein
MLLTVVAALVASVTVFATPGGGDVAETNAAARKSEHETQTKVNVVSTNKMSEEKQASQAPGQSDADEAMPGPSGQQTPSRGSAVPPAGWIAHVDPKNGFSISYPKGFVVKPQEVAKLAQFTPRPVASIFFMNPTMAAGALAGVEPPDLEVRVYQAGAAKSLTSWLAAVGFTSGANVQPYRNANVSGQKVCQSTLIAPGCSVYILRSGRVYQLTPISMEGEAMMETFAPIP